jgi:putative DNA primase/helicase
MGWVKNVPDNSDELTRKIAADVLTLVKKQDEVSFKPHPNYIFTTTDEKTGKTKIQINYASYSDFLKNYFHIIYFNKTMFIYDHGSHLYRKQTNEIETHIRDTCIENSVGGKLASHLLELRSHLTSMGAYSEYPFNTSITTIPVENGIVKIDYDTEEITLLPHSPEHLFTYKLSVTFDPNVKNCASIPLLKRMVEKENVKSLVQIPAQALLQMQTGHAYKKAYLLQGEPHAGKTSYLKLLYMMFGDEFTTAISLQQLCEDRFVGGNLEGKLLNIYDDLEDVALEVIDQFKTLTGDCRHGIERKYAEKYTGKVTTVHIFTCNYPPEYPDKVKRDTAFWARWEYIKFPFAYPVNPNFYTEWYTQEKLSSFFNLILSAMIVIKKRGLISNSDIQEVMLNWSVNSDPMYDFVGTLFEANNTKKQYCFSKMKLYDRYLVWCNENGIPEHKRKISLKAFTGALQPHGFIPERKRESGNSYEVYSTTTQMQRISKTSVDLDYHPNLGV